MADAVWAALVAVRVCAPFQGDDSNSSGGSGAAGAAPYAARAPQGSSRAETERRRALALKALDQRLQAATAAREQPQPREAVEGGVVAQPLVGGGGMEVEGGVGGETRGGPEGGA